MVLSDHGVASALMLRHWPGLPVTSNDPHQFCAKFLKLGTCSHKFSNLKGFGVPATCLPQSTMGKWSETGLGLARPLEKGKDMSHSAKVRNLSNLLITGGDCKISPYNWNISEKMVIYEFSKQFSS